MAKKPRTEKQLANDERLRQQAAARRAAKAATADKTPESVDLAQKPEADPTPAPISNDDYQDLLNRIKELEQNNFVQMLQAMKEMQSGGQVVTNRGVVGTMDKYTIDPKAYPDPRERLIKEPKLSRFAFSENYDLEFEVTISSYETKDNRNMREPKFHLNLVGIVWDEETGEPTNGRYYIRKAIFHEDPQAAIAIANENGLAIDEENEKAFLDEMRYLRYRDWLLEVFYRPRVAPTQKQTSERVIDGRVVEFWEANQDEGADQGEIPFKNLKRFKF